MKILYVDESGGFEAPGSSRSATPLMVIAGIAIDHTAIPAVTSEFLKLKARFFPGKVKDSSHLLDYVLAEIKGADLRTAMRSPSRNKRRHVIGFLEEIMKILERHDVELIGRVWIKAVGEPLAPRSSYTFAIQDLTQHFQHSLASRSDIGMIICDGRVHHQDAEVSHSVFTQKNKLAGDAYPNVVEAPVFGGSQNHVGLQLADLVASAFLFPMATRTYCVGHHTGPHMDMRFDEIKTRFGERLRARQYRYQDGALRWRGGIVVSDKLGNKSSKELFNQP